MESIKINYEKKYGKYSVQNYIDQLEPQIMRIYIQKKKANKPVFDSKTSLKTWLKSNNGFGKHIPELFKYFSATLKL